MTLGCTTVSLSSYSRHCRGHLRLEAHPGDADSGPRCPPNRGQASEGVPDGRAGGKARSRRGGRCHEADQAARRCGWLAGGASARWWGTSPLLVPTRCTKNQRRAPPGGPPLLSCLVDGSFAIIRVPSPIPESTYRTPPAISIRSRIKANPKWVF